MSELLTSLRERRKVAYEQAKAIADKAATENRALTEAEEARFHALQSQLDTLDARIEELAGKEQRARAAEDVFASYRGTPAPQRPRSPADAEIADSFRSAVLERNPKPIEVRWETPRSYYSPSIERRDLLTTAPANLHPVSFYSTLIEHMVETSAVLRAGATLVTTDSGEPLRVPRSTGLSTADIVAEAAAIPESDPALDMVELKAYKYGVLIQVSTEMAQDSGVDLAGYLARETGIALGNALGNHLINGTGSGQPRGVLLDAMVGIAPTGTGTSFGSQGTEGQGTDVFIDLYSSLAEPYTRSPAAAWLMRTATLGAARKLKTATQGEPVGTEFVTAPTVPGSQGNILNAPVYVDPFVPTFGTAGNKSVIFGDWSKYVVRMVNGVRFERSDDYAFDRDMVTFRALLRADGALVDTTGAIKVFQHTS